jgi:hypothetical protein
MDLLIRFIEAAAEGSIFCMAGGLLLILSAKRIMDSPAAALFYAYEINRFCSQIFRNLIV